MTLPRAFFARPSTVVARELLGHVIEHRTREGTVAVRLTEVEAYAGEADPASHAYRGRTARNATMFGEPGHAYVYFTYGMHHCMNLVCGPPGVAEAVLLRAGEVVTGITVARLRSIGSRLRDHELAVGPARLTRVLGVDRRFDGADVCDLDGPLRLRRGVPPPPAKIRTGPRSGVVAAKEVPWRFWIDGEPSVSRYRRHTPRPRRGPTTVIDDT